MIPFDFTPIVSEFALPGGIDVTRRDAATMADGIATPGTTSTVHIDPIVVMPMSGREAMRLPLLATQETVVVIATQALRTYHEPSGVLADIVHYNGETYEVAKVEAWGDNAGFWRAYCAKVIT